MQNYEHPHNGRNESPKVASRHGNLRLGEKPPNFDNIIILQMAAWIQENC